MPVVTKPSNAPGVSLSYVTIGAILAVLSGTSYVFIQGSADHPILGYIRLTALILGIVFLLIGFGVGRIGQVSGESQPVAATAVVPEAAISPQPGNGTPVYTTTNTTRGA